MHRDDSAECLRYEFDDTPAEGTIRTIADGVHWLRMPLPFGLSHINLWLLEDGDSLSLVDTGVGTDTSREVWRQALDAAPNGGRVARVLVTHMHPDHAGCAGWLVATLDADLWMPREEYLLCRVLCTEAARDVSSAALDFYRAAGLPDASLERYREMAGVFGRLVDPLPDAFIRLCENETIEIGGCAWEILIGRGHSPEHACLYDAKRNLLISGDQILPTISSNVSVFPTEPAANPLDEWLRSLRRFRDRLPENVLVLPAHGRPFRGVHRRLAELIDEHEQALDRLVDFCRQPRRVVDVFPPMFERSIRDSELIMATGESIAHLHYLIAEGVLTRDSDDTGVAWFSTVTQ